MHKIQHISIKIILPILGILLVGIGVTTLITLRNQNLLTLQNEQATLNTLYVDFVGMIDQKKMESLAIASTIANIAEVNQAFADKDRDRLIDILYPSYEVLTEKYDIYQAQFHLSPATSFLRLHSLDKFGDDLSATRKTIVIANETLENVAGLEQGAFGFGIRGVVPVFNNGKHIGAFEIGMNFDETTLQSYKDRFGKSSSLYIPNLEGTDGSAFLLLASTELDEIAIPESTRNQVFQTGIPQITYIKQNDIPFAVITAPIFDYSDTIVALIEIQLDRQDNLNLINKNQQILFFTNIAVLIFMIFLTIYVIRKLIEEPITKVMQVAENIANHDLQSLSDEMTLLANGDLRRDVMISTQKLKIKSDDEIGKLRSSFNTIITAGQKSAEAFSIMANQLNQIIGKYSKNTDNLEDFSKEIGASVDASEKATQNISHAVTQMESSLREQETSISQTAQLITEMSSAIEGVAQGAQEQALAVNKAAEITNQLSINIEIVDQNASTVMKTSKHAAERSAQGVEIVSDTIKSMQLIKQKVGNSTQKTQELGEQTYKINSILETIQEISSQTNLLALNAAIEAARAGEHGKGFAVVADEVRKLAERVSNSTSEINGLISAIQLSVVDTVQTMEEGAKEVDLGVLKAQEAGQALNEISKSIEDVLNQAKQTTQAAQKMSADAIELEESMGSVSAVVEENTAATEEMAASSSQTTDAIREIEIISKGNTVAISSINDAVEEITAQMQELNSFTSSLQKMTGDITQEIKFFKLMD